MTIDRFLFFLEGVICFLLGSYFYISDLEGKVVSVLCMIGFVILCTAAAHLLSRLEEDRFREEVKAFFRGEA